MKKQSILLTAILLTTLSLAQADQTLVDLVKKVKPCVVLIETFDKDNKLLSQGSGFFVNNKGHIVTNHHILKGAYRAIVKTSSGSQYPVEGVIAKDIEADIVKFVVNLSDANITPLNLSTKVPSKGEEIVVICNPLGLESTGIVSAVRDIPAFGKILQITAPISPDSSGSPVINSKGEIIGIATIVVTKGQHKIFTIPNDKIIALKETSKTALSESYASLTPDPNDAQELFCKGLIDLWQENWYAALTWFQKATEKNLDFAEAYYNLGDTYVKLNRWKEAIKAFKQVIRIKPDFARAHLDLGVAYFNLDRYQDAIESCKESIKIKPEDSEAQFTLGAAYHQLNLYQDAIEAYKQAIRVNPDAAYAYYGLGKAYEELGRWQEAIEAYKQAIRIKPDDAYAHYGLGNAYFKLSRYQEAIDSSKQAIKIKPDLARAHYNLGAAYGILGSYHDAVEAFQQAIKIKSDYKEAYYGLGLALYKLNRWQAAIKAFKRTIIIEPGDADAHYMLGITCLTIRDMGSAYKEYNILKTLDPEKGNELYNLINK